MLFFIVAAAGLAGPVGGSQPEVSRRVETADIQLQSGSIEFTRLVDLASQRLGVRLTYEEQALKSKVTLRLPTALSDRELWDLTNRLLAEQGLVTARIGGAADPAYSIVRIASAAQLARAETYRAGDAQDPGAIQDPYPPSFIKLSITLSHLSVRDAAAAISPLLSKPGGSVAEEPATRTLTISDFRAHAEAAAAAALAMDVPSHEIEIAEYTCQNITPSQLLSLATQVMGKRDSLTGQSLGASPPPTTGTKPAGELVASPHTGNGPQTPRTGNHTLSHCAGALNPARRVHTLSVQRATMTADPPAPPATSRWCVHTCTRAPGVHVHARAHLHTVPCMCTCTDLHVNMHTHVPLFTPSDLGYSRVHARAITARCTRRGRGDCSSTRHGPRNLRGFPGGRSTTTSPRSGSAW